MKAFLPHQTSSDQSRSSAHSQRRQPLHRQDQPREVRAETTQPKPITRFGYSLAQIPIASPDANGSPEAGLAGSLRTRSAIQPSAVSSAPLDQTHISAPLQTKIATPHAAAPVIQRAGPPVKASLLQPTDVERSGAVPDLTTLQVKQITDATSDTERLAVIKVLAEDLVVNKGLLSTTDRKIITTDPFVEDNVCIKVAYKHGKDKLGLTYFNKDLGPNNDQLWLRMDIYEGAFSAPSILYSTIRHELIHVAQRLLQPDPHKASGQDPLMYEYKESYSDTYKRGRTAFEKKYASKSAIPTESAYKKVKQDDRYRYAHHVGYMTAGAGSLQEGLQEAEAHLWELEHMEETGVPPAYSLQTLNFLLAYLNQIVATINNRTTLQISYWEGYVNNITENIDTQKSAIKTLIEKWSDTAIKTDGLKIWAEVVQKAADLSTAWASKRIIAPPPTSKAPGTEKLSTPMKRTKKTGPKKKN